MDMKCLIRKHGELMCSAMLALHAFSGCDSINVFIRKGKITARKTLVKHPVFVDVFGTLGVPEGSQSWRNLFAVCMVNYHTQMSTNYAMT